ncbi:MAG: hypothetical protein GKC04_06785 [Methanomicrobiales archaeon]|nr:hypothetical protein [Methanomicrobiales archaeon]
MNRVRYGFAAGLILFGLLACAGCADLPNSNNGDGFFGPPVSPTSSVTPTPAYLVEETPIATLPPTPLPKTPTPVPTVAGTPYVEIYNETLTFNYNITALGFNLSKPPLNIGLTIHPVMVERYIETESSYGSHEMVEIRREIPVDNAEFVITIYDKKTGSIVLKEGYGKAYSYDDTQTIVIRTPGWYQIEMTGSFVTVDVAMTVPPENIDTA